MNAIAAKVGTPPRDKKRQQPQDEQIGEGTHGFVFKSADSASGSFLAVKRLKPARDGISTTAYREMALVRNLSHPSIVKLLDVRIAPRTEVKVNLCAWPLISVPLIVARIERQITIQAALGDALKYFAVA